MIASVSTPSRPWRRWPIVLAVLLLAEPAPVLTHGPPGPGASKVYLPPVSLRDPRLEPIRMASASWELRAGPQRQVVDQVCLVPDVATFLEAVATWDDSHFYPILIDDVESSFRFIRAFRPARIVRYPKVVAPVGEGMTWQRALAAVAGSWTSEDDPAALGLAGDAVPSRLGATPPGVVFSAPTAPMLAGAVALAAGRFQPLIRVESRKRFGDLLSPEEFAAFDRELAAKVSDRIPDHARLADGCDFLTLAGDYPYRYRGIQGPMAVDDAIGRLNGPGPRWAFAGRMLGDPASSVYRAMCSLFLQPESAAMFNGYDEVAQPWSAYSMRSAALRLSGVMPTAHYSGDDLGSVDGWHELFQAGNLAGLLLINSSGSPTSFNLRRGPGGTPDVPRGVPAAVFMIHSYSAVDPNDPTTIAGRWLANGAFIYYGSMEEPFLNAFRPPRLLGELLGEHLPMVVAARATPAEPFGTPWRLVYLGDPLYRLRPRGTTPLRLLSWSRTDGWPVYVEVPRPDRGDDAETLRWALKMTLARLQTTRSGSTDEIADIVVEIPRSRLPGPLRPIHDALLADLLLHSRRRSELRATIAAIPRAERTAAVNRTYETVLTSEARWAISKQDFTKAQSSWRELIRLNLPPDFKETLTHRITEIAATSAQKREWGSSLRNAIREQPRHADAEILAGELKKIEGLSQAEGR